MGMVCQRWKKAIENRTFNTKYARSDDIEEVAWCAYNSEYQTHTVGTKKPNALGLYDCIGNICEWCYDTDSTGYIPKDRPYRYDEAAAKNRYHIFRGGGWSHENWELDINFRESCSAVDEMDCGLRIVRTANPKKR